MPPIHQERGRARADEHDCLQRGIHELDGQRLEDPAAAAVVGLLQHLDDALSTGTPLLDVLRLGRVPAPLIAGVEDPASGVLLLEDHGLGVDVEGSGVRGGRGEGVSQAAEAVEDTPEPGAGAIGEDRCRLHRDLQIAHNGRLVTYRGASSMRRAVLGDQGAQRRCAGSHCES